MHIKYQLDKGLNLTKDAGAFIADGKIPQVVVVNKFTEDSAKSFREDFSEALDTGQNVVPITIDSYGGQIDSLMSMIDIIRSSPVPVITFATGKAMSCGVVLLTCGKKRYIGAHSRVMIHDVASGSWGKVGKLKVSVKEADKLNDEIYKIMEENIGKKPGYLSKIVEKKNREDWFLTADQALKHNVVTDIGVPGITVSLSMTTTFG